MSLDPSIAGAPAPLLSLGFEGDVRDALPAGTVVQVEGAPAYAARAGGGTALALGAGDGLRFARDMAALHDRRSFEIAFDLDAEGDGRLLTLARSVQSHVLGSDLRFDLTIDEGRSRVETTGDRLAGDGYRAVSIRYDDAAGLLSIWIDDALAAEAEAHGVTGPRAHLDLTLGQAYGGDGFAGRIDDLRVLAAPPPQAPLARDDALRFEGPQVQVEDGTGMVVLEAADLMANDIGAEGGTLGLVSGPSQGTLQIQGEASILVYRFDLHGFTGTDRFTYDVTGPKGVTGTTASVSLDIAAMAPPLAAPPEGPRDDALAFDWALSVDGDLGTGMAAVRFSRSDLVANDEAGPDPSLVVGRGPSQGVLQAAGEGSEFTYVFDPSRFDGSDAFTYRLMGEDGMLGAAATVSLDIVGVPARVPAPATLWLIDARTDRVLFELGASTLVEADSVAGLELSVMAEAASGAVRSARLSLDGAVQAVENLRPYALFGDASGDYLGGLALDAGDRAAVGVELFGGRRATGLAMGEAAARIEAASRWIQAPSYHEPDVIAFDETRMGLDVVRNFEAFDRLAFFGGTLGSAGDVLDRAREVEGDTVIDFGDGNLLRLEGFTGLGLDDIAV